MSPCSCSHNCSFNITFYMFKLFFIGHKMGAEQLNFKIFPTRDCNTAAEVKIRISS